jgi:hypothetical protein
LYAVDSNFQGSDAESMTRNLPMLSRATVLAALLFAAGDIAAQPAEQFFARKTITVTIGYTAGGSYDLYGRMIARHLGKHIPGQPTVIAQNMPGAGSLKAANYLYEVAPKDGTALGVIVDRPRSSRRWLIPAATRRREVRLYRPRRAPATTSSCSGIARRCSRSTISGAWSRRSPAPARDQSPTPCRSC